MNWDFIYLASSEPLEGQEPSVLTNCCTPGSHYKDVTE